ncbi:MAG TPA: carbohydrate-binding protein [Streptosporangiaceae bacterium]|nr:carbohydrate-binding protein [Streptosporangiaceae bacterium]
MSQTPLRLTRLVAVVPPRFQPVAAAVAAVLVAAGGLVGAVAAMAQAAPLSGAAGLSANWYESAPYYYAQDSQGPNVSQVMSATGQKAFDMAFILSGGGCSPSWEGNDPVSSDTQVGSLINQVRANGGDVIVSMGGYNGTKLGQVCGSASATAAAYQQVISKYNLHAFDFDLEEPEIENSNAIANELGAAQILQRNNPGLFESVTMPSTTSGANYFGQLLLDEAKSLGYTPQDYSIMPFDGGFNGASSQITALQGFHTQLMNTFGWSSSTAYAHEGFSGMNGRTDSAEFFYQSDFQSVLTFAENNRMSRFTFWSVNRDRQCNPPDNNGNLSSECSSVSQASWAFTAYTVAFANSGPVVPPSPSPSPTGSPTPSPTGTGGGGGCPAAWVSNTAYVSGNVVSYQGHKWTANQWNYDEVPGGSAGAWNDNGPC